MSTQSLPVLVFRTNVSSPHEVDVLARALNLPGIHSWNFDLEDCDRILRVEGNIPPIRICSLLGSHGYLCEELE